MTKTEIWEAILQERDRQDEKWGKIDDYIIMNSHDEWLEKLKEEIGEVEEVLNDITLNEQTQMPPELIHCAAVIVSWLEDGF